MDKICIRCRTNPATIPQLGANGVIKHICASCANKSRDVINMKGKKG